MRILLYFGTVWVVVRPYLVGAISVMCLKTSRGKMKANLVHAVTQMLLQQWRLKGGSYPTSDGPKHLKIVRFASQLERELLDDASLLVQKFGVSERIVRNSVILGISEGKASLLCPTSLDLEFYAQFKRKWPEACEAYDTLKEARGSATCQDEAYERASEAELNLSLQTPNNLFEAAVNAITFGHIKLMRLRQSYNW